MYFSPLPSQDRLKELFDYNPETGIFIRLKKTANMHKIGEIVGHPNKEGYLKIVIDGKTYSLHRLAWMYYYGEDPLSYEIDHHNLNKSDNSIINLRKVTRKQNSQNKVWKSSKGMPKGVHKVKNKYQAMIFVNGKNKHLGLFSTPELAHEAYKKAAIERSGDFARWE